MHLSMKYSHTCKEHFQQRYEQCTNLCSSIKLFLGARERFLKLTNTSLLLLDDTFDQLFNATKLVTDQAVFINLFLYL